MMKCPLCKKGFVRMVFPGKSYCTRFPLCTYSEDIPSSISSISSYVVFDLETTGLSWKDKIIEIGAVKVRDGKITDEFESLVNPGFFIDMQITKLTGITNQDLAGQPNENEVIPKFLDWLDDVEVVVAHNLPFDAKVLKMTCRRLSLPFPQKNGLCTLQLARKMLPTAKSHKLGDLCATFAIPLTNAHRALNDVIATQKLFETLRRKAAFIETKPLSSFVA